MGLIYIEVDTNIFRVIFNLCKQAGNKLVGKFPFVEVLDECGLFKELVHLDLSGNSLSGALPQYSFDNYPITSLRRLHLNHNLFNGTLPDGLGHFTFLEELGLQNNKLFGTIPEDFGSFESMKEMRLDNNFLTGNLPASLGNLSSLSKSLTRQWYINIINGNLFCTCFSSLAQHESKKLYSIHYLSWKYLRYSHTQQ